MLNYYCTKVSSKDEKKENENRGIKFNYNWNVS